MREFNLRMLDDTALRCYEWTQVKKPRAVIQIMPGFHEYMGRYARFAMEMNEQGFIVVGGDHRGHGNSFTPSADLLMRKGRRGKRRKEKSAWTNYLDDQKVINSYIQRRWPSLPIYVVGQALGATLATRYVIDYGKTVNGVVLSGSTHPKKWQIKVACNIIRWNERFHGSPKINLWLHHFMSGASFPKEGGRNTEAWVSHDPSVREQLHTNPLMTWELNGDFMTGLTRTMLYNTRKKHLDRIPNDFPILILSGKKDVLGNYTKQPREFKVKLKTMHKKVDMVTFPRWRNDVLNNPNPKHATEVLIAYVNRNL